MNKYYIPINGWVEVEAPNETEAYKKAKEMVRGFEYSCGDILLLSEDEPEESKIGKVNENTILLHGGE